MYYRRRRLLGWLHCFASERDAAMWESRNIDKDVSGMDPDMAERYARNFGVVVCHYPAKPNLEWETDEYGWWPVEIIDPWTIRWELLKR